MLLIFFIVGNKAKGWTSKTGVTRKQSTSNFPKNEHLLPDTHTHVYVTGMRNVHFSENLACFAFL